MGNRQSAIRNGFTLVELMISIVLVLLLILGINQVFTMTSRAVGAGAATGTITRDNRAAQATMFRDFQVMVSPKALNRPNGDAPFFAITSSRVAAFRNRADELSDLDYPGTATFAAVDDAIRTRDLTNDNDEADADDYTSPAIYNSRNHRIDVVSFFARDLFQRQTGNDGVFVADMSGTEAWIKYGHLRQPNAEYLFGTKHREPGYLPDTGTTPLDSSNDPTIGNPNNFHASNWIFGRFYMVLRAPDSSTGEIYDNNGDVQRYIGHNTSSALSPLAIQSQSTTNMTPATTMDPRVQYSRYDIAGTTIGDFWTLLDDFIKDPSNIGVDWWTRMQYRAQGNPFPTKPFTSEGLARTVPVFVRGCTQFMVEYAGDFVTQNASNGAWVSNVPDGIIDFVVQNPGDPDEIRSTRWYGFPRDTDGDGDVQRTLDSPDVLPLRDLRGTPAAFERDVNTLLPSAANYAATMAINAQYVCVWGPDTVADPMPSMLRITLAIDDPNGRIDDAMTFEYVIQLP